MHQGAGAVEHGWNQGGFNCNGWCPHRTTTLPSRSTLLAWSHVQSGEDTGEVAGWTGGDNQAAVHAVNRRSCRDKDMMRLIRCLFFLEAWFSSELVATHLPGRNNMLADDLSRDRLSAFLSKVHSPDPQSADVPPGLQELLLDHNRWISPRWTRHFFDTVTTESRNPPGERIGQARTDSCHFVLLSVCQHLFHSQRHCCVIS